VPPWALLGKRLLGQGNVWLNRRHKFDRTLLPALVQQAASVEPDMVLLCGDLTSTALPGEFDDCLKALAPLVDAFPVMIVPGNHDRYTFTSARRSLLESAAGTSIPPEFPHCHRYPSPFNRWRLLALDAARPRGLSSRGEVGKAQLAEARRQIADLTDSDGLIVLCHYALRRPPTLPAMRWSHRLADAPDVEAMLADCPARILYVHGHVHMPWCWRRTEAGLEHVVDINAGAPCLRQPEHPHGHGFWQIDLPDDPNQPISLQRHIQQASPQGSGASVQWCTVDGQAI
jgi:calcineurin-like phosphoesterase family protein